MDVQSCKSCGRIFSASRPGICPKCKEKEEEDLKVVTESLRDEPNQNIDDLAENTGVEKKVILKFIREGKIASDAVVGEVKCGRCGRPAESLAVRLCAKCSAELQKASAELMNKESKPVSLSPEPEGAEQKSSGTQSSKPRDIGDGYKVHEAVKERRI